MPRKQPKRIYFVRFYISGDLACLPDSQVPCTSLQSAKDTARELHLDDFMFSHHHDIQPISRVKASYFEKITDVLVVAQNPGGRLITIEMLDDPVIIVYWWDEERGEFADY